MSISKPITFYLTIAPQAQERIRFYIRRGKISPYTPDKTKSFQSTVREMVRQYVKDNDIDILDKTTVLKLTAIFYLARPKSAKKRLAPYVRPDLSNFLKSLEDALQPGKDDKDPVLFEDDSSICSIYCEKRYVDNEYPEPGILVTVEEWRP